MNNVRTRIAALILTFVLLAPALFIVAEPSMTARAMSARFARYSPSLLLSSKPPLTFLLRRPKLLCLLHSCCRSPCDPLMRRPIHRSNLR